MSGYLGHPANVYTSPPRHERTRGLLMLQFAPGVVRDVRRTDVGWRMDFSDGTHISWRDPTRGGSDADEG